MYKFQGVGNYNNNMAIKTFISDAEMEGLIKKGSAKTPDFIPDAEADQYFGTPKKKTAFDTVSEFSAGAIKPFGAIGERVLEPVAKGLSKVTGKDIKAPTTYRSASPDSTAFKVGEFVGETAQFAIPGTAIAKATKLPLIGKMIAEGVSAGTVASLQQGDINKESRDIAIVSSLFPGLGKLATTAKLKIGQKSASRIINSLIKPLKKDVSYGKNPGEAVAREGIVANSLDDLETKIQSKLDTRINELNKKLAESNVVVNAQNVMTPLDDAIKVAVKQNNPSLVNRLQKTRQALTDELDLVADEQGLESIQSVGVRNLTNMTAEEATRFKRDIGEITAFTGNPSDDKLVNGALKRVYGNVKGEIEKVLPSVKPLNDRIANLISAKTATKYRGEIAERQNLIQFTPKVVGTTGLLTSIATGNPLPFIVSLGEIGLQKALETPKAKTELAKWLISASKENKAELFQKAPWARGVIQNTLLDILGETE